VTQISPRFLWRPTAFFSTCWSRGMSESSTYEKQRICRCNSASTHFHVSWLSDFIFYPKPLYKSLRQSFSIPQKVVLHSITAQFCLRPSFRHVDFHFRTYKRDLAILTEWWQQRIAWWELLNAACQIICIRKQQHRYKAYSAGQTVPSTAQIRAEGNNTNYIRKTADLPLQLCVDTFPCFVAIGFYFLSETLI
jgi:hypothetical protein